MADDEQRLRDMQREYLDFLDDEVNYNSFQFLKMVLFEWDFCPVFIGRSRYIYGFGQGHDCREIQTINS